MSVVMDISESPQDEVWSGASPVRVFIVNDHALARQGLRDLLEHEGFEVVGESGSAAEATLLIHVLNPDVAILDERLPDGTGIEVCRDLRSSAPEVKCLILTGWDAQHAMRATILAGASGYLVKRVGDSQSLVERIRSAAAGRPLLDQGARARVAESLSAAAGVSWLEAMTVQEREVFGLMARGLTNRQIEKDLAIPGETVARCVSSVLQKLGFRRRGELSPTGNLSTD